MLKRLLGAVLFGVLAVASVPAQSGRLDNFLGTWKMTQEKGMPEGFKLKSEVLNVALAGDELQIERIAEGTNSDKKDYSTTRTTSYKTSGATTTEMVAGQYGGVATSFLQYRGANKLRLFRDLRQDNNMNRGYTPGGTEYWALSDDGKTLTIEFRAQFGSTKRVYTKQQ